jgi:hypothetical protein
MVALGQIPGRADFISSYTTQSDTEDEALLFQQMAELLADYTALVAPVQQIKIFVNLSVAYTAKGEAVMLLLIDRRLWTERSAALAANLAQNLPKPQPVQSTAIWMTGDRSALAEAGVRKVGLDPTLTPAFGICFLISHLWAARKSLALQIRGSGSFLRSTDQTTGQARQAAVER